jgi:hypothetical protein
MRHLLWIPAFFIGPFFIAAGWNSANLWNLNRHFKMAPRDPDSKLVTAYARVGLLHSGNGNNCSYLTGEVRSYEGTFDEIDAFYKGHTIPSVATWSLIDPERSNPSVCRLKTLAVDDTFLSLPEYELPFFDEKLLKSLEDFAKKASHEKFYFLYCADTMYRSGWDLRCT